VAHEEDTSCRLHADGQLSRIAARGLVDNDEIEGVLVDLETLSADSNARAADQVTASREKLLEIAAASAQHGNPLTAERVEPKQPPARVHVENPVAQGNFLAYRLECLARPLLIGNAAFVEQSSPSVLQRSQTLSGGCGDVRVRAGGDVSLGKLDLPNERTERGFGFQGLAGEFAIEAKPTRWKSYPLFQTGAEKLTIPILNRARVILAKHWGNLEMLSHAKQINLSPQLVGDFQYALRCGI